MASMNWKRLAVLLALIFGPVTVYCILTGNSHTPITLDREKWDRSAKYREDVAPRMVRSGQLLGLDAHTVRGELGQPDRRFDKSELTNVERDTNFVWWYAIRFRGSAATDTMNLVLVFDKDGWVSEAYVRNKD
jgi:hypothetical protein